MNIFLLFVFVVLILIVLAAVVLVNIGPDQSPLDPASNAHREAQAERVKAVQQRIRWSKQDSAYARDQVRLWQKKINDTNWIR